MEDPRIRLRRFRIITLSDRRWFLTFCYSDFNAIGLIRWEHYSGISLQEFRKTLKPKSYSLSSHCFLDLEGDLRETQEFYRTIHPGIVAHGELADGVEIKRGTHVEDRQEQDGE